MIDDETRLYHVRRRCFDSIGDADDGRIIAAVERDPFAERVIG